MCWWDGVQRQTLVCAYTLYVCVIERQRGRERERERERERGGGEIEAETDRQTEILIHRHIDR